MRVAFEVLMLSEGMKVIGERIESRAILHRLWLEPDIEAALARIAPNIRAIVATWHSPKIEANLMARLPRLEIVPSFGVGYDHVDTMWAVEHGVVVTHTRGVLDAETADTAMALTLMAVRRYPQAERYLRAGRWPNAPFPLSAPLGGGGFGADVFSPGRKPQDDAPYLYYPSLLSMAKACDILIISAPGGATT